MKTSHQAIDGRETGRDLDMMGRGLQRYKCRKIRPIQADNLSRVVKFLRGYRLIFKEMSNLDGLVFHMCAIFFRCGWTKFVDLSDHQIDQRFVQQQSQEDRVAAD